MQPRRPRNGTRILRLLAHERSAQEKSTRDHQQGVRIPRQGIRDLQGPKLEAGDTKAVGEGHMHSQTQNIRAQGRRADHGSVHPGRGASEHQRGVPLCTTLSQQDGRDTARQLAHTQESDADHREQTHL